MDNEVGCLNDIEIFYDKHLGSGSLSKVKLGRSRKTNQIYAVKIVT